MRAISFVNLSTQFENVGDALIIRELIRLVGPHSSEVVVNVGGMPEKLLRNLDLDHDPIRKVVRRKFFYRRMMRARLRGERVYWFLTPGARLSECAGYVHRTLWRQNLMIAAMSLIGVRVCHVGVSYERLGPNYLRVLRFRLPWLYVHRVRDPESVAYLRRHRLRSDGISPDLSFNLFTRPPDAARAIRTVGFCFRADQYPGQFDDVMRFAGAVRQALGAGIDYRVLAQVERDFKHGERIAQLLSAGDAAPMTFEAAHDIETCLRFYEGVDLVVANRMHALLMGASRCGRFLAGPLGDTNQKIFGLLTSLGMTQHGFRDNDADMTNITSERIKAALAVPLDGTAYRSTLKSDIAALFA